jgi:hypothetical protein
MGQNLIRIATACAVTLGFSSVNHVLWLCQCKTYYMSRKMEYEKVKIINKTVEKNMQPCIKKEFMEEEDYWLLFKFTTWYRTNPMY